MSSLPDPSLLDEGSETLTEYEPQEEEPAILDTSNELLEQDKKSKSTSGKQPTYDPEEIEDGLEQAPKNMNVTTLPPATSSSQPSSDQEL